MCVILIYFTWPWFLDAWRSNEGSTNAGGLVRWPVKLIAAGRLRAVVLAGHLRDHQVRRRARRTSIVVEQATRSPCNEHRIRRAQHGAADVRGPDLLHAHRLSGGLLDGRRRACSSGSSASSWVSSRPDFLGNLTFQMYGIISNDLLLAIPFFTLMGAILERCGLAEDLLEAIGQLFGGARRPVLRGDHRRRRARRDHRHGRRLRHRHGPDLAADHAASTATRRGTRPASSPHPAPSRSSSRRRWCWSCWPISSAGRSATCTRAPSVRASSRSLYSAAGSRSSASSGRMTSRRCRPRRARCSGWPLFWRSALGHGAVADPDLPRARHDLHGPGDADRSRRHGCGRRASFSPPSYGTLTWKLLWQGMETTMRSRPSSSSSWSARASSAWCSRASAARIGSSTCSPSLPGGQVGFLVFVNVFVFILAFFLDFFEIAFIIIPLLAPVAEKLGIDLIWFGVLLGANMQTSFMHPPFGFALFYLRGIVLRACRSDRRQRHLLGCHSVGVPAAACWCGIVIFWPASVTYCLDKPPAVDPSKIEIQVPTFGKDGRAVSSAAARLGLLPGSNIPGPTFGPTLPTTGPDFGGAGTEGARAPRRPSPPTKRKRRRPRRPSRTPKTEAKPAEPK